MRESRFGFIWGIAIFGKYSEDVMPELIAGTGIAAAIIGATIWIPYFMKSGRNRLTFAAPGQSLATGDPGSLDAQAGAAEMPPDNDSVL